MNEEIKTVQVENTTYVRDISNYALLNTDRNALNKFNTQRRIILEQQKEKEETKKRLGKIEKEMSEIKQLLKEISLLRSNNGN